MTSGMPAVGCGFCGSRFMQVSKKYRQIACANCHRLRWDLMERMKNLDRFLQWATGRSRRGYDDANK